MWRSAQMTPTTATPIRASVNSMVIKPTTAPKINLIASTTTAAMTIHARTRLPRFPTAEPWFSMVPQMVLLQIRRSSVLAGAGQVAILEPHAGEPEAPYRGVAAACAGRGRHEHEPPGWSDGR